ncbi:MAG TPA: DNA-binding protein WhiA [Gaiellaceae bacterium]
MSLSDDLRNELAAIAPRRRCDRLAELSGLFHAAGSVNLRGRGELSVHLDVGSSSVARRAFILVRAFGLAAEIRTYRQRAFDRATRYQLRVEGDDHARAVLREAGVLDAAGRPLERPPKRVVGRSCCRGAYLRGALLAGGSLSGPRDPHLEVRTATESGARFLASVAAAEGTPLAVADRGRHVVAYAKGAETIADVLGLTGASDVVLALQEHAVVAATRAGANRLANADHANLVRASRAAHVQLEAVRTLQADGTLERLPPALRELAQLRLRHPTLSLRELALRCRPPTTKSAAFRRFRRLQQIADR